MDTNKARKKLTMNIAISLSAGLVLLAAGVIMKALGVRLLENDKALISLSFIPLALATYYILTAALAKRNPKYLRHIATEQTDERIAALKQRADSITFSTLRWALSAVFFAYTLAFPSEIFVSAGWWITFMFFFVSQMMQAVVLAVLQYRDQKDAGL